MDRDPGMREQVATRVTRTAGMRRIPDALGFVYDRVNKHGR